MLAWLHENRERKKEKFSERRTQREQRGDKLTRGFSDILQSVISSGGCELITKQFHFAFAYEVCNEFEYVRCDGG